MKIGIVSGYFAPAHIGHVKMINSAKRKCDHLIVVINNNKQQIIKKGKVIIDEYERASFMTAIRGVDEVMLSCDSDKTVCATLEEIAKTHDGSDLIFFNGGDRQSITDIPETEVCNKYNIEMVFGCGGNTKANSSTNINKRRGIE